jgi:hypothetical protein
LALVLATFALAAYALAEDHSSLVGKWNMTSESDGDPVQWVLVLKDVDGKMTGTLSVGDSENEAKDLTCKAGVIRFQALYQGAYYDIELKLKDAKLEGTWSGNNESGRTYGSRAT